MRIFLSQLDARPGQLGALAHGPFASEADARTFLETHAAAGRWLMFSTTSEPKQFDVPPRVVTPVEG